MKPKFTTMLSGNRPTRNNRSCAFDPQGVPADRRSRGRLRDLCDEVIASHRAANDGDIITDADRADARIFLAQVAPLGK